MSFYLELVNLYIKKSCPPLLSQVHMVVKILRLLAKTIDSDEREMFLYESEEMISAAPVLRVYENNDK